MKMRHKPVVLALDDDEINLMILVKNATEAGFEVKPFADSLLAWEYLVANPGAIDIAVIDKMMPEPDGMELLNRIKHTPNLRHIPVIMQTGDTGVKQMCEGLERGAYYYLTKPFSPEVLSAILHAADNECKLRKELMSQMSSYHAQIAFLMEEGRFAIRTHAEARLLVAALSHSAARAESVSRGLTELLFNAIEHGNLEIGFETKRNWLVSGRWAEELANRAADPAYNNRKVQVKVEKIFSVLHVTISDEGRGFDWQRFMNPEASPDLLTRPSGRGILIASGILDDVRYQGNGSEVRCNIASAVTEFHEPVAVSEKRLPSGQA